MQTEIPFANSESIEQSASHLAEYIALEDDAVTALDTELKDRKKKLDEAKEQLCSLLQQAGLTSIKLASGLTPSIKIETKYYKQKGVADEQLFGWLHDNGLGGIIKPTVHHGTLNSTLTQFTEQGGTAPELIFNISEKKSVRMNGKSKFLAQRNLNFRRQNP